MPCQSKRNFGEDMEDGRTVAKQFSIETITVDLSEVKRELIAQILPSQAIAETADKNIAPRLRMATVYAIAQSHDFNPIHDLTVTEVYEFLRYLKAPQNIIDKAPSAGLFEGQTDESELGISYAAIDEYLLHGTGDADTIEKIESMHRRSLHKLKMPMEFRGEEL